MELTNEEKKTLRNALAAYRPQCEHEDNVKVDRLLAKLAPLSGDYIAGPYIGSYKGEAYQYVLIEHTDGGISECKACPFQYDECGGIICSPGVVPQILKKLH